MSGYRTIVVDPPRPGTPEWEAWEAAIRKADVGSGTILGAIIRGEVRRIYEIELAAIRSR